MIEETITYSCRSCGSPDIIRNGRNKCGNEQYHCKACGCYRVLRPKQPYSSEQKAQILSAYGERMSLRGLQRVFGVWCSTVLRWLEQLLEHLPSLPETLLPLQAEDVLEMDELVSFVSEKWFKRWLRTAQCRRTRQIVAFAIGDRSETTARHLWQAIPSAYRSCPIFTDQFKVYPLIVPAAQHHPVPKGSGLTNHQERWYNTLRQSLGRYTRRTLSFSKQDRYHELVTHWFILQHNLAIQQASLTM
jgi:insertion element IS1 protein InsB